MNESRNKEMTVKELRKALGEYHDDMRVLVDGYEDDEFGDQPESVECVVLER